MSDTYAQFAPYNPRDEHAPPEPLDHIDFIDLESRHVDALLSLLDVAAHAMTADEDVDPTGFTAALRGMTVIFAGIQARVAAIHKSAHAVWSAKGEGQ